MFSSHRVSLYSKFDLFLRWKMPLQVESIWFTWMLGARASCEQQIIRFYHEVLLWQKQHKSLKKAYKCVTLKVYSQFKLSNAHSCFFCRQTFFWVVYVYAMLGSVRVFMSYARNWVIFIFISTGKTIRASTSFRLEINWLENLIWSLLVICFELTNDSSLIAISG